MKTMKKMMTWIAVAGLVLALAPGAVAESIFDEFLYTPYGAATQKDYARNLVFTVGATPRQVTHLGCPDLLNSIAAPTVVGSPTDDPTNWGDGIAVGNTVNLYLGYGTGGTLLASAVIGPSTTLYDSGFRWEELPSPVTLEANTQYTLIRIDPNLCSFVYPQNAISANWNDYWGTLDYSSSRSGSENLAYKAPGGGATPGTLIYGK